MRVRRNSIFAVVLIVAGVLLAGVVIVRAVWHDPDTEIQLPSNIAASVASSSPPRRLRIPTLGIDAAVQRVGINAKGNMAVPSNFKDVAWYKYGAAPGDEGSAVIDGHVDNGLSLAGVFKNLHNVQVGDEIEITAEDGTVLNFKVRETADYAYNNAVTENVFKAPGKHQLVLITCEGTWIPASKTYDHRLVVFADLEA